MNELTEYLENNPNIIAVTCSMSFYRALRDAARTVADYNLFGKVQIYIDGGQKEDYKGFYHDLLLQEYLQRNEK